MRKTNLLMPLGLRKNLFRLLMALLAIVASITSVKADTYYNIKIIPVCEEGASGVVFAYLSGENSTYQYQNAITKDNKWKASLDTIFETSSFYLCAKGTNSHTVIEGWYWDEECTQLSSVNNNNNYWSSWGVGKPITAYPTKETARANPLTFYVKFKKVPTPVFDWSSYGVTPANGGKYYIYCPSIYRFLKATSTSTASVGDATVFTYIYQSSGSRSDMMDDDGLTPASYSYNVCNLSYQEGGVTKYASCNGSSYWTTTASYGQKIRLWPHGENMYVITKDDYSYGAYNKKIFNSMIHVALDGTIEYITSAKNRRGPGIYWIFIPESEVLSKCKVKSLDENGDVTITASPTAEGTAYVKFNVSAASAPSGFEFTKSGADASDWVLGTPTCGADSIMSVPVTYTAKSVHKKPASSITVTVTAKNDPTNTMSGTATANVDYEPRFALMVDELDWSRVGEEVVETFYSGQEVAASERNRLANKLVKNDTQTTGIAANNATWTATITGTNANQFKFVNGTDVKPREVSGLYSSNLLDVIYAPTTTGNHTATLHIVTSYTDADSHTETYERDITLRGVGSDVSRITFAKAGNQMPTNAEEHNFGEITGTNSREITANLFISQISNPKMEWTGDSAGVFEFVNSSSVDLTNPPLNQTLTFRAHRKSPVTANTIHTATLTISGKGTANEDVSATITLSYTALPLKTTTVTWNWATIKENSTVSNPITTNSDGAWTLEKSAGEKITYNSVSKTATVPYLHHEPGNVAEFVLNIPQTDTYTAFSAEYETNILPLPAHANVNRKEYLGDDNAHTEGIYGKVARWASNWETWDDATKTLQVRGDNIWFYLNGCTKFEFDFEVSGTNSWAINELDKNGSPIRNLTSQVFTAGHNVLTISQQTATLNMKGYGKLSNIEFYEVDTIAANKEQIALIYDNGNVTTFDVTTTFANKQQVTVSLNAAAAQYFEIRSEGKATDSSMEYDSNDGLGLGTVVEKTFTIALKTGANVDAARTATAGNACQLIFADNYTYNHEVLSLPVLIIEPCEIKYQHSEQGAYTVTYQNDEVAHTVDNADYDKSINTTLPADYVVTLSAPNSDSGYQFQGWKINNVLVSCLETFTTSVGITGSVVEAAFVPVETQNFKVGDVYFANFDAALSAANTSAESKVVTLMQDVTLGDGTTTVNYTIPAGITFLVPHKADFFELQETPEIVVRTQEVLSAYRTLTLKPGVTINCDGNICVSGKLLSDGGGNKSAYTTGECGVINMAIGGHIELNNGAQLYCWGYIKGQDMDQGNNTVGTGTVNANAGSVVWENFELGDWRGGSASMDIYNYNVWEKRMLFPFQSYAIQNVEVPLTFNYGSVLKNYTSITTGLGNHGAVFSMIGPSETMFLLPDAKSKVRTWYDPTTDLSCYELSGTAQLDALHITVYVSMSSEDFILPICNSMHIIMDSCNMTLAKPLMVQAGAIIEIKKDAIVNLTNNLYMYDVDQWGKYAHNYYFRSFNNITSHKDRGAEDSKDGLDDAKFIIDGVFNINSGGKLYTTKGGANVMGNNGGIINFNTSLPDSTWLWAVEVAKDLPYITWVRNRAYAANLCNEDGSYTRSVGNASFYNIHGRWFHEEDKEVQEDHTYYFTYMANGNSGEDVGTAAVYSHDKTGLEERMKWFNVTKTKNDCTAPVDEPEEESTSNWWIGTNPAAYYNYTMLGEWHQFMAAEGEGVYSGSNNALYQKDGCEWAETGVVDENCLYTFVDGEENITKKALVDGHFIPLTSNGYDPAYHKTDDATKYYICFQGCNWHPATPYTGESKAYTIHPEDEDLYYIWFNGDWMNVLRDEPFFYTEDGQTNVRTYYEYVNGEWEKATPYVSVSDAIDPEPNPRTFYMIKEAFNVASIKKDATITLLRDLPNVSEVLTYTTQNTTCTLDLNGHLLGGNIANLVTVNAPGATFTITDNSDLKNGKILNEASKAVYVQKGTLVVANGTIESTAANAVEGAASTTITINGGYFAAGTKCVQTAGTCSISGGHFTKDVNLVAYAAAHKYPFETTDPKYKYEVSDAWTITFMDEANTLLTLHVKPGEMPIYTLAAPTKEGYKFTGWNTPIVAATADATYTAQFEVLDAGESCVTLNSNGGKEGLQYVYVTTGEAIGTVPAGTTKDGHTFAGWWTTANGGEQVNAGTTVSADVTWYAHYTVNHYTMTWDANGGELSGSYTSGDVNYGASITAPTATFEGHTFLGWNATPATKMPAQDVTYTAQWSIVAKHYKQNLDGTYPVTPDATENVTGEVNAYVTPAVKTYSGFITPATQTVRIGETDEVRYEYARRTYTITWDANGGTCATASTDVKHGATATLPEATWANHTLDGWFTKAVGGDEITASTIIQRNIGTLYAHWSVNVIAHYGDNIDLGDDVTNLIIENGGTVNATTAISVTNLYLESNGSTTSGQLLSGANVTATNAYFDLTLNAVNHKWYGVAVPWQVNASNGISVNGRTLTLGKDFDIIYYDGARRAAEGKQKCWSYVEDDGDKTLVPGRLYMIGLMSDAQTVRFTKKFGAALLTTNTSVTAHSGAAETTDQGWNGVANPALFYAFVNPGTGEHPVTEGQVYLPDESRYEATPLNTTKFVVGEGAFVQALADKAITVSANGAFAAPRRANANATNKYDVRIAPADADYTDRLFVKTTDNKETDEYIVGQDLVKMAVSSKVAQLWVDRYGEQLCVNTQELTNEMAYYPLGIRVPKAGEYTISQESMAETGNYTLYLTYNGEVVWNLSDGAYTFSLPQGETMGYGLRIVAKTPSVATGVDEALIDAQGNTRKVLIDNKVYIIRGNNVYSVDGQLVK